MPGYWGFCSHLTGYKEKENGFAIPALFDAEQYRQWPGIWRHFFEQKCLPITKFLTKVEPSARIFEESLTEIIDVMSTNHMGVLREIAKNYKAKLYPSFHAST